MLQKAIILNSNYPEAYCNLGATQEALKKIKILKKILIKQLN